MPHTSRDNFKAKWIAAREEIGANTAAKASVVEKTLGNIHDTQFSAGQELKKVQHVAMEAAAASRELIGIMDECRNVNDLKFAECGLAIDEKLSQMPLNVMLRRVRDVVKMASVRIGYMTAAYEDMHKYVDAVEHQRRRLSDAVPQFQRELLSSVYIGPSPSTDEIEDYRDNKDGRFRRFGLDYQDLSDDWYETELFAESNLREKKSYKNEVSDRSDVESDDDDDVTNSAQSPQQRALVNRSARIVPRTNSIAL